MSNIKFQISQKALLTLRLVSELKAILPIGIPSNLNTKVHLTAIEQTDLDAIEKVRESLLSSGISIPVMDFGVGSKKTELKTDKQEYIRDVCRIASKPKGSGLFLYNLIRQSKSENILELGTCLGISSAYIAMALKHQLSGKMITMEGSPARAKIADQNLKNLGLENYASVQAGKFQDILEPHLSETEYIDFAFIDGHHDGDATVGYFDQLLPKFKNGGIMVFDDIFWSVGMNKAWKTIRRSDSVKDSFEFKGMGIVQILPQNQHQ